MLLHIHFRLQAAIFDFLLTPTNCNIYLSPVVLTDIENIGIVVGISLLSYIYKLRYTLFHIQSRLQVAIFNVLLTMT